MADVLSKKEKKEKKEKKMKLEQKKDKVVGRKSFLLK